MPEPRDEADSEWPDAPRLTEALANRASDVEINTVARARVAERLDRSPSAETVVLIRRTPAPPTSPASYRRVAVVAACVLALAIGGAGLVTKFGGGDADVRLENPAEQFGGEGSATSVSRSPSDTSATPQPSSPGAVLAAYEDQAHCARTVDDIDRVDRYALEADGGLSGVVSVRGKFRDLANLVLVVAPTETESAPAIRPAPGGFGMVHTAAVQLEPGGADAALARLEGEMCGFGLALGSTVEGYEVAARLVCGSVRGTAPLGYVFETRAGPPACALRQPTILLSSGPHPALNEWASNLGCTGENRAVDDAGNTVVRFDECGSSLLVVETATDDPWSATIEGRPATEFIDLVLSFVG